MSVEIKRVRLEDRDVVFKTRKGSPFALPSIEIEGTQSGEATTGTEVR